MMAGADAQSVLSRVEQVRRRIAELRLMLNGQRLPSITVSAGIAQLPGDADTAETLIAAADRAMYAAKSAGRDRVVVLAEDGEPSPAAATTTTLSQVDGQRASPLSTVLAPDRRRP